MQKGTLQGKANKYVFQCFWHEGFGTFYLYHVVNTPFGDVMEVFEMEPLGIILFWKLFIPWNGKLNMVKKSGMAFCWTTTRDVLTTPS
jgi:hypothetical protein